MNYPRTFPAYAKINLTLEALAKRSDGYHEIASVLQTISLHDTLSFEPCDSIKLSCTDPNLESDDNLVVKAAYLLRETTGCRNGCAIHLTKGIPSAAGLGSGSSDAATTLIALNRLWNLNLSRERLADIAAQLGSDTTFFLYGGTALARGRGEKVTVLPSMPGLWIVLLSPEIATPRNKTGHLYSKLNASHLTSGQFTEKLRESIIAGQQIEVKVLYNVFEQVAFEFFTGLAEYRSHLQEAGAGDVSLAGSGPTLFTIVPDKSQGEIILEKLLAHDLKAYLAQAIGTTHPTLNRG